jgi:succinate dehydrogenase flavin-adding protein (antitoxin of CptAB toxin-antitoxin module)
MVGYFPFISISKSKKELFLNVLNDYIKYPKILNSSDKEVLKLILNKDPSKRPSFNKIVRALKGMV